MPVTPLEFAQNAEAILHADSESEITQRSSCSRAHYGAYHSVSNLSDDCEQPDPSVKGSHKRKIVALGNGNASYFGADLNMRVRSLGIILAQTRDLRVDADYNLSGQFCLTKAQTCITQAFTAIKRAGEIEADFDQLNTG